MEIQCTPIYFHVFSRLAGETISKRVNHRAGSLVPTTVKDLSLGTTHRGKILEGWAGGTVLTIQMDLLSSYGDTPAGIEIPTCQIVT